MPSKVLDVSEQFGPSETSIREIVRSELHLSVSTVNRVDTIRLRKVSIVHSMESKMTNPVPSTVVNPMPSATANQGRPEHRKANQRQRSNSHWRNNLSKQEREDLHELNSNPDIKILLMDKNVGPAFLSTDWVQAETLRYLHDEFSYYKVTQQDWYANRLCVINSRERLMSIYSGFISSNVARFLHKH